MLILGVNQDLYDCGVTLTDGEKILYSAGEERFSRRKNQGGFPRLSMDGLFKAADVSSSDIGMICVSGVMTPPLPMRVFPWLQNWVHQGKREVKDGVTERLIDFVLFQTPARSHIAELSISRVRQTPTCSYTSTHGSETIATRPDQIHRASPCPCSRGLVPVGLRRILGHHGGWNGGRPFHVCQSLLEPGVR